MFNRISLRFPRFTFRIFLFSLFILVIVVLVAEGGYYFWVQRETKKQTKNPVIARQEGVFSYVNLPDGTTQKVILGTIKGIDGNLLTIKTDNNKTAQVLFTGENVQIADLASELESARLEVKNGTIDNLLIGDKVTIAEIYSENGGQIKAKALTIIRGADK